MNYKGLRTVCSKSKELKTGYLQLEFDKATNTIYSSFCEKKGVLPCRYFLIGYLSKEASMVEIESLVDKYLAENSNKNFKANVHFTVIPAAESNYLADVTVNYNSLITIKGIKLFSKDGMLNLSFPKDARNYFLTFIDKDFEEYLKNRIFQFYHSILNNTPVSNTFYFETHKKDSGINVYINKSDYGSVKATTCLYLNNLIKINQIKIVEGKSGPFVAWPSIKNTEPIGNKAKQYLEIISPANPAAENLLKEKILTKYKDL